MDKLRVKMDAELPQNIYRRTVEPIDGDSLKRYEEITNIMVNEYGYRLVKKQTDDLGYTTWFLTKETETGNNQDMLNEYEIKHTYTIQESLKMSFDHLLPQLKDSELEPMYTYKFPKIRPEHRR